VGRAKCSTGCGVGSGTYLPAVLGGLLQESRVDLGCGEPTALYYQQNWDEAFPVR